MARQLWVKISDKIQGPFTAEQLRQLAASRKLRPDHQVSADQVKWVAAARVKGLDFSEEAPEPTTPPAAAQEPLSDLAGADADPFGGDLSTPDPFGSPAQATGFDDAFSDLGSELPSQPSTFTNTSAPFPSASGGSSTFGQPGSAAAMPPRPQFQPQPSQAADSVAVRDKTKGGGIGAVVILGTLFGGCVIGGLIMGPADNGNDAAKGLGAVIMMVFWLGGIAAGILAMVGTGTIISAWNAGSNSAIIQVRKRIAFVPMGKVQLNATSNDMLVGKVEQVNPGMSKGTIDLIWILLIVGLCAAGGFPGLIFWFVWLSARNKADSPVSKVRLFFRSSDPRFDRVPLVSTTSKDQSSLRFGAPREIEQIVAMVKRHVAIRVVLD